MLICLRPVEGGLCTTNGGETVQTVSLCSSSQGLSRLSIFSLKTGIAADCYAAFDPVKFHNAPGEAVRLGAFSSNASAGTEAKLR